MRQGISSGRMYVMALGGLVAMNLICLAGTVLLDVVGSVAPQFSLPLLGASLLVLTRLWLMHRAEQQTGRAETPRAVTSRRLNKRDDVAGAAQTTTSCSSPAGAAAMDRGALTAARFRSVMIIRRRPAARFQRSAGKENYAMAA